MCLHISTIEPSKNSFLLKIANPISEFFIVEFRSFKSEESFTAIAIFASDILTLFAMGFYGVRDNYTTKSKSK